MVTKEEMKKMGLVGADEERKASYRVTAAEMRRFEVNNTLALKVYNKIKDYTTKHNIKPRYEGLVEQCQLDASTLSKSCAGKIKITRYFLYKFTVGLKMSVKEANEFFSLCGGALAEDNIEDYICIKALEDKDDILLFIEQFNEFVNKYNSLNYKEKANEKNNKDKLKNIVANHRSDQK